MLATKMPAVTISRFRARIWLRSEGLFMRFDRPRSGAIGVAPGGRIGSATPCPITAYMDDTHTRHGSRYHGHERLRDTGWRHEPGNTVKLEGGNPDDDPARDADGPAGRARCADRRPEHGRCCSSVIGLVINLGSYWFSDKIALKMSRAQPLSEEEAPRLHQIVRELAHSAGIPMPRLYMIPGGPAERVRDRPQPEALGRRGHARASRSCSARPSCAACSPTSWPTSATATS